MKKILILLSIFYTFQANAANFTDTIGAECGRILFALNVYDYPTLFDAINNRNKQFDYLEKCIKLYKDNGGTTDDINQKYFRAYTIYEMNMGVCFAEKDTKKKDECKKTAEYGFNENLTLSSYELSNKYSYIYDNLDEEEQNKETLSSKFAKRSKEITQEWFEDDLKKVERVIEQMNEQNNKEEPKKGFFSWFK